MGRQSFEPEDFKGSGQYLLRSGAEPLKNPEYSSTVLWKIGFLSDRTICFVSATDGFAHKYAATAEELCRKLNDDERGYRKPTDRELIYLLTYIGSRNFN